MSRGRELVKNIIFFTCTILYDRRSRLSLYLDTMVFPFGLGNDRIMRRGGTL
jgi:hypothetical protein